MHTPIVTTYVGTTKLTAIKLKTESFENMLFIHLNKQNVGVLGWPLNYSKVPTLKSVWQVACLCAQTGASSWLWMCHLSFSCGNPARLWPGENTALREEYERWFFILKFVEEGLNIQKITRNFMSCFGNLNCSKTYLCRALCGLALIKIMQYAYNKFDEFCPRLILHTFQHYLFKFVIFIHQPFAFFRDILSLTKTGLIRSLNNWISRKKPHNTT